MTKQELASELALQENITQAEAIHRIDRIFQIITNQLYHHKSVKIRGFGTFKTVSRNTKKIRNPKTGETMQIPNRVIPTFTASPVLKKLIGKELHNE